jgi:hypothetical protein
MACTARSGWTTHVREHRAARRGTGLTSSGRALRRRPPMT